MRLAHLAAIALLLSACSDNTTPPVPGDLAAGEAWPFDGPRPPRRDGPELDLRQLEPRPPGEFGAGGCDQLGNHFQLRYMVKGFDLVATDVKTVSGQQGVIGVTGTSLDGHHFWFGREGDPDLAAFSEVKVYYPTHAPYHILLQRWPVSSGASCTGNPKCETYYGLNGIVSVLTARAPTHLTFNVGQIVYEKSCWVEQPSGPPKLTCPAVGGNFFGCFKVN